MKFVDSLITAHNGKVSHTRLWSNVAYSVATGIVIYLTINDKLTHEYFFTYLAVVACHASASKLIATKESKDGN
jgi:hypothetical protein